MKMAHRYSSPTNMPVFMQNEDWLTVALKELDTNNLSIEEKVNLEIKIAREQSQRSYEESVLKQAELAKKEVKQTKLAIRQAKKEVAEAKREIEQSKQEAKQAKQEAEQLLLTNLILATPLSDEQIAQAMQCDINKVKNRRAELFPPNQSSL